MMGRTHKLGGLCTGVIASTIMTELPITTDKLIIDGIIIGTAVFGSLLPDIDHTNSTIGKQHKILSKCTNVLFGHRGITHAPLVYFLSFGLIFYFLNTIDTLLKPFIIAGIFGLFLGIMSHLLLDMITKSGIPILYPFSKEKVNIARFSSSKHNLIVSLLLLAITGIVVLVKMRYL